MYFMLREYTFNIKQVCCFKYDVENKELTVGFINTEKIKIKDISNDAYKRFIRCINLHLRDK